MLIGIIGAPNKGKSTFFSAVTMNEVAIADYPFTTIDPNKGVAYATTTCVEKELKIKCNARNSLCINGTRMIPVNLVDVAGLVEGAHKGKGMGNKFLNDLASSDALIIVIDMSGTTDQNGNPSIESDPSKDIDIVINEITEWIAEIIERNMKKTRYDKMAALNTALSGMKIGHDDIEIVISKLGLSTSSAWTLNETKRFSSEILTRSKKILIAANKIDKDIISSNKKLEFLREKYNGYQIIGCSSAIELALKRAEKSGIIKYLPGSYSFELTGKEIKDNQRSALNYMKNFIEANKGTGIQAIINKITFDLLDNIVVYPVEDENKYADHFGNILPDAILIKNGSTTRELAEIIHTDIAKGMLYAIDAKSKMRIGKEHVLSDKDIVKIVSAAK